jgi:hypothetical protein
MVIKALAMALMRVPDANVTWTEGAMLKHKHADVGVAVALPGNGLITPIIRAAETKTLSAIANADEGLRRAGEEQEAKARRIPRRPRPRSRISACSASRILPPSSTRPTRRFWRSAAARSARVVRGNELAIATVMSVTLSCDHRAVDGAPRRPTHRRLQAAHRKPAGYVGLTRVMAGLMPAIHASPPPVRRKTWMPGPSPGMTREEHGRPIRHHRHRRRAGRAMWRRSGRRKLGFKTAVVEREHLGGIGLNWGCIPTKALLRSAEIYHYMEHAKDYGLSAEKIGFDAAAIVQRSRGVSGRLNGGVGMLLKKNKVDVIWGEASISKPGEVVVSAPKKPAVQPQNPVPKGVLRPAPTGPSTSSWPPARGPACCRASSRTAS